MSYGLCGPLAWGWLCLEVLSDPRLLGDTGGEMRGTSTGVGFGLSGTSCPKEYGGCMLVLPSFRACSFHVFLNLHRHREKPHRCSVPPVRHLSEKHRQLAALQAWLSRFRLRRGTIIYSLTCSYHQALHTTLRSWGFRKHPQRMDLYCRHVDRWRNGGTHGHECPSTALRASSVLSQRLPRAHILSPTSICLRETGRAFSQWGRKMGRSVK